jgi:hypothetical protein
MTSISDKYGRENQTYIWRAKTFVPKYALYEAIWKIIAEPDRLQVTV